MQGIIRFLSNTTHFPDTEVPLAFPPDRPRNVRVNDAGGGEFVLAWDAPLSDGARGDPATGYVAYVSTNGYGFGSPVTTNGLSLTVSGVPIGETRYYRLAATNQGGESMPSEVLTVRRQPESDDPQVLIVNGFDRLRRFQNPIQTFTQPPAYAGDQIERQIWRRTNSYDYAVQFAQALDATTVGFVTCSNDTVINYLIDLGDYDIVLWILGTESTEDATLNGTEQSKLEDFLSEGGALFLSGAEIGYDLIDQGAGVSFMQDWLRVGFVSDDADTYNVTGAASGILDDIGAFDFDFDNGAPYPVYTPDQLTARTDALGILNYVGGTGGTAGVQYDAGTYRAVTFGFPFETITSASTRSDIMERIVSWLESTRGPLPFDYDKDGDVDLPDFYVFRYCWQGPAYQFPLGHLCEFEDGDGDQDVDLADFALFQAVFTGPK